MGRKYPSWGEFLKKKRFERYRSAREFCSKEKVGISYPQYSRYEAGDQLPNLDQAILLCRLLGIPILEGVLEWCLAQVTDSAAAKEIGSNLRTLRMSLGGAGKQDMLDHEAALQTAAPSSDPEHQKSLLEKTQISLDHVIVFNRSHLKLFNSNPVYRDIFTYVNSFSPDWISAEELSLALRVSAKEIESMLEDLSDHGVLLLAGGKCRTSKKTFYFPDDEDFYGLRNQNLSRNVELVLDRMEYKQIAEKEAYRGVVTRELTKEQVVTLIESIENVLENILKMPESDNPEKIYSLCMLLGERFRRVRTTDHLKRPVTDSADQSSGAEDFPEIPPPSGPGGPGPEIPV